MAHETREPLAGSERSALDGAKSRGDADPNERFRVTLILRRRASADFMQTLAQAGPGAAPIARDAFGARFGYRAEDAKAVRAFAESYGLRVEDEIPARRTVALSGTVAQFSAAFGVELKTFDHAAGTYRGRTGPVMLPATLAAGVQAVLGLDNRPAAKPHFRRAVAPAASYSAIEVAQLYGFPAGTGEGQCIALIELGGGYRAADLQSYFGGLGLAVPDVGAVAVDGGANAPTGSADGPDGEVMLDIEVAGALAPAAKIVVYFAPNTDAGFLDAVTTAVHDETNKPSVVSISWGGPESSWTAQAMTSFNEAFQAAATLGVTVCVASGDNGSSDGVSGGGSHADFPASSPYALGCGGTTLDVSGELITSEVVWNGGASGGMSGGGVSTFFSLPSWQAGAEVTAAYSTTPLAMRGVPDVCGDADPDTGYQVVVDGSPTVIGGTSAVAPLWAGLIARINATSKTPVGYINPKIYAAKPYPLRDIVSGNNGGYEASVGWDACTGLGSPNGAALAELFGVRS